MSNFYVLIIIDQKIKQIENLKELIKADSFKLDKNKSLKIVLSDKLIYVFTLNKEILMLDLQFKLIKIKYLLD